jgi:hypothetical protein
MGDVVGAIRCGFFYNVIDTVGGLDPIPKYKLLLAQI